MRAPTGIRRFAARPTRRASGVWVVRLAPNAQPLAAIAVRGMSPAMNPMMREFDARRARPGGGASFIGPEVFEKSHTGRITDILRRGVYAGPGTMPAQYQGMGPDASCGLILVWTRPR